MKLRMCKSIRTLFVGVFLISMISLPANASEFHTVFPENSISTLSISRATGSFRMSISAKSKALADNSFPMAAGETVTIKASYAPFDASVDFGLVDSNGIFHYFNVTDGSIDKSISIEESGRYTLQIRNNSSVSVQVSGFVKY